jgi:xanthine dehydrogenase accessory factor
VRCWWPKPQQRWAGVWSAPAKACSVGLDLGGDGAEAIALAIIAEMNACVEGKLGVSRRMTAELVEEQIAQGGASRYLQAQCAL